MAQMTNYQVFPIHKKSVKGTASNSPVGKYRVVLPEAAGTVTFIFGGVNPSPDIEVVVEAGQSLGIDEECTAITSSGSVILS